MKRTTLPSVSTKSIFQIICTCLIGIVIFVVGSMFGAYYILSIPVINAGLVGLGVLIISIPVAASIIHKKLSKPLGELHGELSKLQHTVHKSNSELSSVSSKNTALQEALPFGLIVFNNKSNISLVNTAAKRLLGIEEGNKNDNEDPPTDMDIDKLIKTTVNNIISGGQKIHFFDWVHTIQANKIQDVKVWTVSRAETSPESVAFDVIAQYNKQDSYGHELVVALIDRTSDFQRQERQMEFISLAAHELRGPITVMRGLIDVLQMELDKGLSKDHRELMTRMAVSARQLSGYVDNILNVSRVDQQNFSVRPEKVSWKQALVNGTADLAVRAKANRRELIVNIPESLPFAAIDLIAVQHVINNLVDNAIKYSKPGGKIVINASQKGDYIETTVQDTGIGMPASVVEGLFTKFYRSHRSKQIISGTGLGLYLCKAVINAHGGNIWARSTEGVGTTFGFTLPVYKATSDKSDQQNSMENDIVRGSHGWIKNHALYRQ